MSVCKTHVYYTFESFLEKHVCGDDVNNPKLIRFWTKIWKMHKEKHGNKPYVEGCIVCESNESKIIDKRPRKEIDRVIIKEEREAEEEEEEEEEEEDKVGVL